MCNYQLALLEYIYQADPIDLKKVNEIIQFTIDLNAQDQYGRTALHAACEKGYIDIVIELLAKGAHIEARDADCFTPLITATFFDKLNIVEYLVRARADLFAISGLGTALHIANMYRHYEIRDFLELCLAPDYARPPSP